MNKLAYVYFNEELNSQIVLLSQPIEPACSYDLFQGLPFYKGENKLDLIKKEGFRLIRAKPPHYTRQKMRLNAFLWLTREYFTIQAGKRYTNPVAWDLAVNIHYVCLIGRHFKFFAKDKFEILFDRFSQKKPNEIYMELLRNEEWI